MPCAMTLHRTFLDLQLVQAFFDLLPLLLKPCFRLLENKSWELESFVWESGIVLDVSRYCTMSPRPLKLASRSVELDISDI